jgi:excisionase family DNA binding protein
VITGQFRRPDDLIRPGIAARRLGVTRETIRRWMAKGAIAYVEVGPFKRKRLRVSDVEQYRQDHSSTA